MPFTHTDDDRGAREGRATMEVCITPFSILHPVDSSQHAACRGDKVDIRRACRVTHMLVIVLHIDFARASGEFTSPVACRGAVRSVAAALVCLL